ncbi:MAG: ferritin [Anaerolineae bacterium]|nr:ferritin [Anaerolineae bacterium]
MFSKNLLDEMNTQIKLELYSGYLYLSMSAYFEANNLPGFARWMKIQAKEEQEHAMKFFGYINDRGERVVLQAIDQPQSDFKGALAIFEQALEHEKSVTARIDLLYSIAVKNNDYASQSFLNWFVDEQVEEEKNASEIVEWLKKAGDSVTALFSLDSMLGKRADD